MYQQTIEKSVNIAGVGLHSGQYVTLEIFPAPVNTGILFQRNDLLNKPTIPAHIQYLHHRMRCTALVANNAEVHTTEHLLATFFAMGITNAIVEINGSEVPGMDGSALPFYQALQQAGVKQQDVLAKEIIIQNEICIQEKKASLIAKPCSKGLHLTYTLEYDLPGFPREHVEFEITGQSFGQEIAPARTFALKQEVDALLKLGLGKGANLQNTLILDDHGQIMSNHQRLPNELARHKLLDLLGDLALLGCALQGHILGERSGHELNAGLVKKILAESVK